MIALNLCSRSMSKPIVKTSVLRVRRAFGDVGWRLKIWTTKCALKTEQFLGYENHCFQAPECSKPDSLLKQIFYANLSSVRCKS